MRVFESKEDRRSFVIRSAVVVTVFVALVLLTRRYAVFLTNTAELRTYVRGFGALGPFVVVLLQAAQVVVAPVPGHVTGFVSGYIFGAVPGFVYSIIGLSVGSYVAFRLSRSFGRPYVETVIDDATLSRFDSVTRERGLVAVFVLFLIPGLPDDAICFIAGLTEIEIRKLVVVAVVGRAPGLFLVSLAGAGFADQRPFSSTVILVALALVSVAGYLARDWLTGAVGRIPFLR